MAQNYKPKRDNVVQINPRCDDQLLAEIWSESTCRADYKSLLGFHKPDIADYTRAMRRYDSEDHPSGYDKKLSTGEIDGGKNNE